MPFISDCEALKLSERYLSAEQHAEFCQRLEKMRHLEECVDTSTPSPHCKHADPTQNLEWCRLGLRIEGAAFEDLLQEILLRSDEKRTEPCRSNLTTLTKGCATTKRCSR